MSRIEVNCNVGVTGLAEVAQQLPDGDWYELRILFRKRGKMAEVRAVRDIHKAKIVPNDDIDTSDIPETEESFFASAKLKQPKKDPSS